jgi:hypothetical protein
MALLRTSTDLNKYVAAFLNEVQSSMKTNGYLLEWNKKKYKIKKSKENEKALNEWVEHVKNNNFKEANSVILISEDNKELTAGSFSKPKSGASGNRGDIAEGIFGAAITARFVNKNRDINELDIKNILKRIKSGTGKTRDKEFKSINENPKIVDDVRFYLSLGNVNMKALLDETQWAALSNLFTSSVKYANGKTVQAWSKLLYENNRYNYIEVISDGLGLLGGGQSSTKVDVKVLVDKVPTNINVSLKAGSVKQFGQISGVEFEKQKEFHKKLFNADVSSLENKYNDHLKKNMPEKALYLTYKHSASFFNRSVTNTRNKDNILKHLGKAIDYFATLHEENVTLVHLDKSDAKVYNFSSIKDALIGLSLIAEVKDTAGKPKILIKDKKKQKTLLELRVKIENKPNGSTYVRNIVEKGPLLGDLISFYS